MKGIRLEDSWISLMSCTFILTMQPIAFNLLNRGHYMRTLDAIRTVEKGNVVGTVVGCYVVDFTLAIQVLPVPTESVPAHSGCVH